jgi:hypothetical protein
MTGKTCPNAILSTTNPTLTDLELNQGLRSERPSHCTVGWGSRPVPLVISIFRIRILCLVFSLLFIAQLTDWALVFSNLIRKEELLRRRFRTLQELYLQRTTQCTISEFKICKVKRHISIIPCWGLLSQSSLRDGHSRTLLIVRHGITIRSVMA